MSDTGNRKPETGERRKYRKPETGDRRERGIP
jgi:hypothetical protein